MANEGRKSPSEVLFGAAIGIGLLYFLWNIAPGVLWDYLTPPTKNATAAPVEEKPAAITEDKPAILSPGTAYRLCLARAKELAAHPSTVSASSWELEIARSEDGETTYATIPFRAKNSFNLEKSHTIICKFDGDEIVQAEAAEG